MKRFPLRRTALALALGVGAAVIAPAFAVGAPAPTPSPAPVEIAGKKPAQPVPVAKQAGLRAYFVITEPSQVAAGKTAVTNNGGTVYASYDAIGVIVAHSTDTEFAAKVRAVQGIQKVGATRTSDVPAAAANPAIPPSPSQTTPTAAETNRVDMTQIGADKAWDVNPGSASVTVGVLDTGVDDQHYDLKPNFDAGKSASCAYGKLDTREGSWRPVGDHGTHVAGTIAAARNGKGMVGVAPGVKISSVRVAEAGTQLFFPENTVCAFVFAGDKGIQVTNNSYYTDPWLFACPTDSDQSAILEGVKRAVAYAEGKNVLNVAAAGNENYNLAKKTTDTTSPNDSTPVNRTITDACQSLPTELPGVVVVSSVNSSNVKSSFSNYGTDKVHLAAPGDNVYSTVLGGQYGSKSGTSMASPHVAGVAALLASVNPGASTTDLRAKLAAQANDIACPSGENRCTGTTAKNSFYGEGLVDAKESVETGTPSPVSVTSPGDQTGKVGQAASVQVKATDAGGKSLTYAASGLPAGLTINATSGLISGTPTTAGTSSVTVTVTNADGKTGTAKFSWTITTDGGGGTVTVTKPGDQWGFVNWAISPLQVNGSSTAGGSLTYTAAGLPPGLSISSAGRITGTPTKAGTYTVTVTGTDAGGAKGTTSFGWRVYGF
ncbi:S8 family serine peptidase [Crossiella sp. CA-258035]|uniref:S8 family serine peptidase n=1 Tax=Crossiella sp. CA-258035 TaxID=2981138 RepID=UPI0024BCB096|nr:S8 family serine peptidase [Crossiella sp. CA-258035]WHT17465.1 S8 family serine peptidase [Crossiella sp. CA-258035]